VDGDARLSSSFGAAAVAYAEHRPDYAGAAVRWALEAAPGRRVLDLGAGTGKLTAGLLDAGAEVTAVEPDPEMLGELRRTLPDVRSLAGGAEAIPLEDGSVDAVVAGNAMHWFDMDVAGPEIARVLAPGGTLAGLWNTLDDRVDWIAGLAEVSGPAAIGPATRPRPGAPRPPPCTFHAPAPRPHSTPPSRLNSPTASPAPPTPSSRRWRRGQACW
jgi:SAM-dependent methyltransferase